MPAQRFRQTIGPQMQIPATTPAAQDSTERKGDSVASQIEEHAATARGTAERPARSQVLFREVNERIAELSMPLEGVGMNLLVCECSDVGCAE